MTAHLQPRDSSLITYTHVIYTLHLTSVIVSVLGAATISGSDIRPVYGPGKVRRSGRIPSGCAVPVNWLMELRP